MEKIEESLRSWATSTKQFLVFVVVYNDDRQMRTECDGIQSKQLPKRVCEVKARLKYTLVPIVVETNCKKAHSESLMQALQVVQFTTPRAPSILPSSPSFHTLFSRSPVHT